MCNDSVDGKSFTLFFKDRPMDTVLERLNRYAGERRVLGVGAVSLTIDGEAVSVE